MNKVNMGAQIGEEQIFLKRGRNMDRLGQIYKGDAYEKATGSERSALEIVPFLHELLQPKSVVDVGGGIGVWLEEFVKIDENVNVCCIDGEYVRKNYRLNPDTLLEKDLEENIFIKQNFDLAMSLEVAEHLSEKRAAGFVDDLVKLSDIIVFAAAVTFQPGDNHINCRECSYWADLFKQKGYKRIDCIRPLIAENANVDWWYKNNMFLYVKDTIYDNIYERILARGITVWAEDIVDFIHYECFCNIVRMQMGKSNILWKKKTDLLLEWMEFNKTSSVAAWLDRNIGGSKFAVFGVGDIGKKFIEEIQTSARIDQFSIIIDNYAKIDQWKGKDIITLRYFLDENKHSDVKMIINTILNLDEGMRQELEDREIQVVDISAVISVKGE